MGHCYVTLSLTNHFVSIVVFIMNCIPEQSLDPSQPLLHEQVPSMQVPLLLQSISLSHGDSSEREKHIFSVNSYIDQNHL